MSFSFLLTLDKRNVNFIFNVESVNNKLNYLILRQRLHICMRYGALQCSFTENIFHLELNILSDIPPFDVVIISAISPRNELFYTISSFVNVAKTTVQLYKNIVLLKFHVHFSTKSKFVGVFNQT